MLFGYQLGTAEIMLILLALLVVFLIVRNLVIYQFGSNDE